MTFEITSKNERQLSNINWLLKRNENASYESHLDGAVQVVKYTLNDKPIAAIFRDKKKDPVAHYRYATPERREEAIQEQIKFSIAHSKRKAERKAKPKADIQVGDILYTSWGWEQTNIDFYQVTKLVGKATAEYVKIGSKQLDATSWCSADVTPDPSYRGEEIFRGRITSYGVSIDKVRGDARKTSLGSKHHSSWGY